MGVISNDEAIHEHARLSLMEMRDNPDKEIRLHRFRDDMRAEYPEMTLRVIIDLYEAYVGTLRRPHLDIDTGRRI